MSDIKYDSSKVYIDKSEHHPRGVFAKKPFSKDETIEIFPITPIQFRTKYQFDKGVLNYAFINDSCQCQECMKHGYVLYLPMGYGGIYNYSSQEKHNAKIVLFYESFFAKVIATKDISIDTEIITNFSDTYIYRQMSMNNENNQ